MFLRSLDIIKEISRNYITVNIKDGEIIFNRFTEKQMEAYSLNEAFKVRTASPSGVCLDFYTDSEYIKLKYSVKGKSRDWLYFDIYVNDTFTHSIGEHPVTSLEGQIDYYIPSEKGAMKRLTVYIPHLVDISLRDIELSDNSNIECIQCKEKSLLSVGDSITQGMNALHPSSAYPVQLARYLGMNLLNQGVGGYIFNKDSLDANLGYQPDIITIAYGTNDWGKYTNPDDFTGSVEGYMNKITEIYPKAEIYVITPIWRGDLNEIRPMGSFFSIQAIINDVCRKHPKIHVIDGLSLVPNMSEYYGDVKLHPNDIGFMHYTMGLLRHMSADLK